MKQLAWLLKWTLMAAIFLTLCAFALNNQQDVTVNFFFGRQWQAAMVLVVLAAFAAGVMIGVLGMVPRWWTQRQTARRMKKNDSLTAYPEAVDPRATQTGKPPEVVTAPIIDGVPPQHGV